MGLPLPIREEPRPCLMGCLAPGGPWEDTGKQRQAWGALCPQFLLLPCLALTLGGLSLQWCGQDIWGVPPSSGHLFAYRVGNTLLSGNAFRSQRCRHSLVNDLEQVNK